VVGNLGTGDPIAQLVEFGAIKSKTVGLIFRENKVMKSPIISLE